MKRFLIYPLCLMPIGAWAATTFYYDAAGVCDGLFLNPNATLCSQAVTRVTTPTRASKSFAGYYIGNTRVIDNSGNVLIGRTAVPSLTDSNDSDTARATAGFAGQDEILVNEHTVWDGQSNGWYSCSAISFQLCKEGENFYAPPAPNCWSINSWPINTGYDYAFNSWRTVEGDFLAPSSQDSWSNPYPSGPATGDSSHSTGCSGEVLGPLVNDGDVKVSKWKVFPFACKMLPGTRPNTWSTAYSVTNGKIVLNNSTPGKCIYELQCDDGYSVSGTATTQCNGTGCKAAHTSLGSIQSKLGTCEQDDDKITIKYTFNMSGGESGIGQLCTETATCTKGASVTLKPALTCSGESVAISKWTNGSINLTAGASVTCSESALGTATNGTVTLTGTMGGTNPFVCQQTGFTAPTNGSVLYNSQSGEICSYTVSCNSGYTMSPTNGTVTCTGESNCTTAKLNQQFANYTCTPQTPVLTCPNATTLQSSAPDGITVTAGTHTTTQCKYTLTCPTNYTLNGPNSNGQITCTGSNCASVINGYSCVAPAPTFTCPAVNTDLQTPSNAVLTRTAQDLNAQTCTYRVSCDSSHAFPTGDTPVTISCSGTSGSNACTTSALQNRINSAASNCLLKLTASACTAEFAEGDEAQAGTITGTLINNNTGCSFVASCPIVYCNPGSLENTYCNGGFHCPNAANCVALVNEFATVSCSTNNFTCPDPHDLQKPDVMTISRPTLDSSTQTCTYDLGCISGYAIPIASSEYQPTISCTGEQCRTTQQLQWLIDDRQNYKLNRCGKVWSTEACSATYAEGANAAGTIRTYWNPLDYNGTTCILNGKCDELHECNPGSLDNDYCDGAQGCGAGMGSEGVTENCSELVQNYKSVSCSNDCPSIAKVEQFVLDGVEYANSLVGTDHSAGRCVYKVECENGAIMDMSCSKSNGCKLNSTDWYYPPCSYH